MSTNLRVAITWLAVVGFMAGLGGCKGDKQAARDDKKTVISNSGSDTMVNLAQAWAEALLEKGRKGELKIVGSGNNLVDISYIDNVAHAHLLRWPRLYHFLTGLAIPLLHRRIHKDLEDFLCF